MSGRPSLFRTARGYPRWIPAALIALALLLNLITPPHLTFVALFAAAPLLAAMLDTTWVTAVTGVVASVCVLLLFLFSPRPDYSWRESSLQLATVLTVSVVGVVINRYVTRSGEQLASARSVAEAVQRAVVPSPPPVVGPLRCAARYRAAQLDALIGGDLYAAQDTPFGVRLMLGDVRGKGLGATDAVAVAIGAFREWSVHEPELVDLTGRVEAALLRESDLRGVIDPYEGFITAVVVELVPGPEYQLSIVNRGHPPPLLLSPDGEPRYLTPDRPALPLALGELDRGAQPVFRDVLPPDGHLLLYTDGVSEARDADGRFYDPEVGLRGHRCAGPEELLDEVMAQVVAHTDGALKDDLAVLAVHRPHREVDAPLWG